MEADTLSGLEDLVLNQELSPEEYFTIVMFNCENNLTTAKKAIGKVLIKLPEESPTYLSLKVLYDELFQESQAKNSSAEETEANFNQLSINDEVKSENKKKRNKKKKKTNSNSNSESEPVILWFRRDLRLYDNPALFKAAYDSQGQERPVIPVFIWSENEEKDRMNNGGAVKVWLKRALDELNKSLSNHYNSRLILKSGRSSEQILLDLIQETGAKTVVWTALYEPWILKRDQNIESTLKAKGIEVHVEHSYLLHRPDEIQVCDATRGIGSVTHFMECCKKTESKTSIGKPIDAPSLLKTPETWPKSLTLDQMKLYVKPVRKDGTEVDWAAQINSR